MKLSNVVFGLTALASTAALVPSDASAATHYGVACFSTLTGFRVNFFYRWGTEGQWKLINVDPGEKHWIAWTYDFANQNRSPVLYIQYNDVPGSEHFSTYNVKAYASSSQNCDEGHNFEFYPLGNTISLRSID